MSFWISVFASPWLWARLFGRFWLPMAMGKAFGVPQCRFGWAFGVQGTLPGGAHIFVRPSGGLGKVKYRVLWGLFGGFIWAVEGAQI